MEKQFSRLEILYGADDLMKVQNSTVCIVGIGGVGSFAIESLARCGIKKLIIIDKDIVDETNINRQLIALHSTIDQPKAQVMKERIALINPQCDVVALNLFLDQNNIKDIIRDVDFVIDACDSLETKLAIIKHCLSNKIKFVTSLGAANKFDNTKVIISILTKTYNDPLAKLLRKRIKEERVIGKIPVVFSTEVPFKPNGLNLTSFLGSNSFVPSTFGLTCANYCFNELLKQ